VFGSEDERLGRRLEGMLRNFLLGVLALLTMLQQSTCFVLRSTKILPLRQIDALSAAADGRKLATPPTIDAMMVEVGKAILAFAESPTPSRVGIVDLPLPVTGGTELDDWPGGIKQKFSVLRSMLPSTLKTLDPTSTSTAPLGYLNGESGVEDCVAIWKAEQQTSGTLINIVSFATPEVIPELKDLLSLPESVTVLLNPQFFLDPLSLQSSKDFLESCTSIYQLKQLNMRGEALGGALPVRGIVYRAFPGPFQAGRRLDVGGYVLLKSFDSEPSRSVLETLYLEDSKERDSQLSLVDQLKKLVPRFD